MATDILHITSESSWGHAVSENEYRGDTLASEGFIHCCTPEQIVGVHDRYYRGQTGLLVLRIDPERLSPPLKWESPPDSHEKFPHLYGPLNLDAVVDVVALEAILAGWDELSCDGESEMPLPQRVEAIRGQTEV